ncbi:MAG: NosD domain-containing protein, partial [Acidimicrobiia bacterium]
RDVEIRNNVMAENSGPSGYGLGLKDMDRVTAVGNRFVGNRVGMYFDNSPYEYNAKQHITDNLFAYNQTGVLLQPSVKGNVFSSNAFIDNAEQVGVPSSGTFSGNEWSSDGTGNYWSDFAGYDGDGDGIGDVSHTVDDLYNTLADKHPDLQFYQETPAAKAITLAATMFPVLRPRPLVEDKHPLITAPKLAAVSIAAPSSGSIPLLLASFVMLIGAAGAVALPVRRRRPNTRKEATA